MKLKIHDQVWTVHFTSRIRLKGQECYGLCNRTERRIYLEKDMPARQLMRIALHECCHACNWDHDEDAIKHDAAVLTEILWKLGFRLVKPPYDKKRSK